MAAQGISTAGGAPTLQHPNWTLAATILASSLAFIDGSVVNVALPAIGRSLHGDAAGLQWTINAYMLPLSALLLMGGAAGDHFGRRRLLVAGIILFTLASVGCAPPVADRSKVSSWTRWPAPSASSRRSAWR